MAWFKPSVSRFSLPFLRLFRGYLSLVWRSPVPWRVKLRCYASLAGWFWFFRDWLTEDLRVIRSSLIQSWQPWFKQQAPWTGPVWHWMKDVKKRLAGPESAAARARRLRREQLEWVLKTED